MGVNEGHVVRRRMMDARAPQHIDALAGEPRPPCSHPLARRLDDCDTPEIRRPLEQPPCQDGQRLGPCTDDDGVNVRRRQARVIP